MLHFEAFTRNTGDMLNAIDHCVRARMHMPALVLIYSLIDSIAWAAAESKGSGLVRFNFEAWVNRWLLPELSAKAPDLTATDLFGARCAALHTLTGTSDLFTKGAAKRIMYAWGTASADVLRAVIAETKTSETHVALHFDDLFSSLGNATAAFLSHADSDSELHSRLENAAQKHYAYIPSSSNFNTSQGE